MAAALFVLLSVGIIKAQTRRQVAAIVLTGTVAAMLVSPPRVQAQDGLITAIQSVINAIEGVIQNALTAIQTVQSTLSAFYQQVVWPVALINQARALVTQMINQYRATMYGIFGIHLASATLPAPQALEQILRNQQTNDFGALVTGFANVYGPVPGTNSASPYDRDMTDMDDALATDTLKMLKDTDRAANVTLNMADQIENTAAQAAPGSAPLLTAAAVTGAIQSQALTQKLLAAELRQEAAYLAHRSSLQKQGALGASSLSNKILNILH